MVSSPIAEILLMEQLGEIGQRVQMFLKLGSAGVPPATFGVLAECVFAPIHPARRRLMQPGRSRSPCRQQERLAIV
jgi:hypothetical protein